MTDSNTGKTVPLHRSGHLPRVSKEAAALARALYGREPLCRRIGDARWRFRWAPFSGRRTGLTLRLRIGDSELRIGLEDAANVTALSASLLSDVPAELHVAYLSSAGADIWQELEIILQSAVEVVDLRHDCEMPASTDGIGFVLQREPPGPPLRGFLSFGGGGGDETLCQRIVKASRRTMVRRRTPPVPVRWAAVVGSTTLPMADVRRLAIGDTVVIDDACPAAELVCSLAVGLARRGVGRAALRKGALHVMTLADRRETAGVRIGENHSTDTPDEAGVDGIDVVLRFELAQWRAPLADATSLTAGAVVGPGTQIGENPVSVWLTRHCIGHGRLEVVGRRLGVRLLEISGGGIVEGCLPTSGERAPPRCNPP